MKKGTVFFHPIEGSGPLTISWSSGPKGDAIESKKGSGVGFFSETGALLCVIFDDVLSKNDHQTLEFDHAIIEVSVIEGLVTYVVTQNQPPASIQRRRKRKSTSKPNTQ